MKNYKLDKEEKDLLKSLEKGEWKRIKNFELEKKRFAEAARNTLNKTKNINIRITERTLVRLKTKAIEEGLPYQTLAASVLHKFVSK